MTNYAISTLGLCFVSGLFAAFLIMAGEFLYRLDYPLRIAFEHFFQWRSFGTRQMARGLVVGFCLFAIALGWVVTYYLLGSRIGYWCPLDVSSYQVLSSYVPAYASVCIGVEAAFNEELLYRVIGMGLAKRLVRNFWLANLLQALAWGFAHSTYPQQPAYARGVELTLSGLMFGWIMNTFGLVPCIIAHYLLDAFLTGQTLLDSGQPALIASAFLPLLPLSPLILAAIAKVNKAPTDEEQLSNANLTEHKERPPAPSRPHTKFEYKELSHKMRVVVAVVGALCLAVALFIGSPKRIGTNFTVSINRDKAIQYGWEALGRHHVPVDVPGHKVHAWHVGAWLINVVGSLEMQYIYEHLKLPKTIEMANFTQPGYVWHVRFFKEMQPDEYSVELDGNGNELEFDTNLSEDAFGQTLDEPDARKIAEAYIKQTHARYAPFVFENTAKNQRKNRLDYTFTYNVPRLKVGDADSKLIIGVVGDKPSDFTQAWSLPDKWKWEREKRTAKDEISGYLKTGQFIVLIIMFGWWIIGLIRVGYFPFRPALLFGLAMAILYVPEYLNGFADAFRGYSTSLQMGTFYWNQAVNFVESLLANFGQYALSMLIALPCARLLAPMISPLSLLRCTFAPEDADDRKTHRNIWLDAVLIAYASIAIMFFLTIVFEHLRTMVSPTEQESALDAACELLNLFIPSLGLIAAAINAGVNNLLYLPIVAGFYAKYLKRFWLFMLFTFVIIAINYSGDRYWQDYALDCGYSVLISAWMWFMVAKLARFNVLTYGLFGVASTLALKAQQIHMHAPKLLLNEVTASLILLAMPFAYLLYIFMVRKNNSSENDTAPV